MVSQLKGGSMRRSRPWLNERDLVGQFNAEMWDRGIAECRSGNFSGASKLSNITSGALHLRRVSPEQLSFWRWAAAQPSAPELWLELTPHSGPDQTVLVLAEGSEGKFKIAHSCSIYRTCQRLVARVEWDGEYRLMMSPPFNFSARHLIGERLNRREVKKKLGVLSGPLLDAMRKAHARYAVCLRRTGTYRVMHPGNKRLGHPADIWVPA